ncbi:hypothetical protein GF325_11720 [Candidatus Bathyarchaeota archaeon]|nr:hypothetical protein [Candidatus Bathyarchaeota archaeon]
MNYQPQTGGAGFIGVLGRPVLDVAREFDRDDTHESRLNPCGIVEILKAEIHPIPMVGIAGLLSQHR